MLELPKQIIEKYEGIAKDGKLLPMLSCGSLNKNLKVIAKLCNIERKLSAIGGAINGGSGSGDIVDDPTAW